ncbi:MAG: acyltransferase [Betaproteobacteria bacterium]
MIIELLLRSVVHPRLRATLLRLLGASIGSNVRIYEGHFMNLDTGFSNLAIADDVHIAPGYMFDLKGQIFIGTGSTLSPNVTVMTHADPGSAHNSPLCEMYPPKTGVVQIGDNCWIGACATLLCDVRVASGVVVGATSLVRTSIPDAGVYAGTPVRPIRSYNATL